MRAAVAGGLGERLGTPSRQRRGLCGSGHGRIFQERPHQLSIRPVLAFVRPLTLFPHWIRPGALGGLGP